MHLIVDGFCGNKALLSSVKGLEAWLLNAVAFIGMRVIGGPYVIEFPAGNGKERGLSGVIILAESNITVHTYPEYSYVFIDIFSCRDFSFDNTVQMVKETFGMEMPVVHLITRRLH